MKLSKKVEYNINKTLNESTTAVELNRYAHYLLVILDNIALTQKQVEEYDKQSYEVLLDYGCIDTFLDGSVGVSGIGMVVLERLSFMKSRSK